MIWVSGFALQKTKTPEASHTNFGVLPGGRFVADEFRLVKRVLKTRTVYGGPCKGFHLVPLLSNQSHQTNSAIEGKPSREQNAR
jgi:hypothetical protein